MPVSHRQLRLLIVLELQFLYSSFHIPYPRIFCLYAKCPNIDFPRSLPFSIIKPCLTFSEVSTYVAAFLLPLRGDGLTPYQRWRESFFLHLVLIIKRTDFDTLNFTRHLTFVNKSLLVHQRSQIHNVTRIIAIAPTRTAHMFPIYFTDKRYC